MRKKRFLALFSRRNYWENTGETIPPLFSRLFSQAAETYYRNAEKNHSRLHAPGQLASYENKARFQYARNASLVNPRNGTPKT